MYVGLFYEIERQTQAPGRGSSRSEITIRQRHPYTTFSGDELWFGTSRQQRQIVLKSSPGRVVEKFHGGSTRGEITIRHRYRYTPLGDDELWFCTIGMAPTSWNTSLLVVQKFRLRPDGNHFGVVFYLLFSLFQNCHHNLRLLSAICFLVSIESLIAANSLRSRSLMLFF